MNNMIRSRWLRSILLFALVLSAANCGDESEVIIQELNCDLEGFEGGNYEMVINSVTDGCTGGVIVGQYVQPGDRFGPVTLPPGDQLPPTIVIPNVPLVGTVEFQVSTDGNVIRISGSPGQANVPGIGSVTATVSGTFCPIAETAQVDGEVTVSITSAPLIDTPCNVRALVTGLLLGS